VTAARFDATLDDETRLAAIAWIERAKIPRDRSWSTPEEADPPDAVKRIMAKSAAIVPKQSKPMRAVGIKMEKGQIIAPHYDASYDMTVFYYLSGGAPLITGEPDDETAHLIQPGTMIICPGGIRHRVPVQELVAPRYTIVTVW